MRKLGHSISASFVPEDSLDWNEWRTIGLILFLAILSLFGLYWDTVQSMIEVWAGSRTFAHGFLVLPAAGYLIWSYRPAWIHLVPVPNPWGVAALIMLVGGWIVGSVTDRLWIQQAAVVAMLPGLMWAILGWEIVKVLAWPLGYLGFLLPFGTSVEPWLQDVTAWFVRIGLEIAKIPHLYDDNHQIVITTGVWEVAVDCGGLRYLLPGLALGAAFAMLIYRSPIRRLVFLASCAVTLMIANGLRAYGIIIGDHFGIADGTDHRVFSYAIYGLTMPFLFWIGLRFKEQAPGTSVEERAITPRGNFDTRKTLRMAITAVVVLAVGRFFGWLWFSTP
jgi:exosortase A